MKILYVSSLIFRKASSASIRNISLINGLIENGHNVDIVTLKYPSRYNDEQLISILYKNVNIYYSELEILNSYLVKNRKNNLNMVTSSSIFIKTKNIIKNIIKNIYFFPDTDKEWIYNYSENLPQHKYDIIISSSDTKTSHYIAYNLKKNNISNTWYQIWGDPWKDDININFINKMRASRKEKKFIELADKVFYVSYPTTEIMKLKFPNESNKIKYLGRSYLYESYGSKIESKKEWVFTYTGGLNKNRNIFNLLEVINKYNNSHIKKIKLDIYGNVSKNLLNKFYKYNFVEMKGVVDILAINDIYRNSDVLVFIDNGGNTSQIPGKLYDYFGTDRPILALLDNLESPICKFISSINRCIIMKNSLSSLNLNFLDSLKKEDVIKEYSGKEISKKIFKH